MVNNLSTIDLLMARTNRIMDLLKLMKFTKNWYSVVLFSMGLKKTLVIHLKSGKKINILNNKELAEFWNGRTWQLETSEKNDVIKFGKTIVKVNYKGRSLRFVEAGETDIVVKEQFLNDIYRFFDVKDKTVVDIGANVGDTAIYFAVNGARHVFALEPFPSTYNIAKKNIRLNSLDSRITIVNAGYGKNGMIKIDDSYVSSAGSNLRDFKKGKNVLVYSLENLVEKFKISKAALKMDCEGSEYNLLKTDNAVLRRFSPIVIEYHYGYRNLVRKLREAGFLVEYTRPRYNYNAYATDPHMYSGLIKAWLADEE